MTVLFHGEIGTDLYKNKLEYYSTKNEKKNVTYLMIIFNVSNLKCSVTCSCPVKWCTYLRMQYATVHTECILGRVNFCALVKFHFFFHFNVEDRRTRFRVPTKSRGCSRFWSTPRPVPATGRTFRRPRFWTGQFVAVLQQNAGQTVRMAETERECAHLMFFDRVHFA